MKAFLGALGAVSILACAGGDASNVASSREPIVGGDADTTSTNIVMVYIHSQTQGWVDCTGTVISPHVALTAGHCLDTALIGLGANPIFKIFVGQDIYASPPPSELYAAQTTIADPLFVNATVGTTGHDVGVVVTQAALPLTPVPFARTTLDDSLVGQSVRLVGYGLTDPADGNSDGRRNSATTTIATLDALSVTTADQLPSGCEGDSGGAMLVTINGVETLVGVISHGIAIDNCKGTSIGDRIDLEASFLEPIVDQYDPGFLPVLDAGSDAAADAGGVVDPASTSSCAMSPKPTSSGAGVLALFAMALTLASRRARRTRVAAPQAASRRARECRSADPSSS